MGGTSGIRSPAGSPNKSCALDCGLYPCSFLTLPNLLRITQRLQDCGKGNGKLFTASEAVEQIRQHHRGGRATMCEPGKGGCLLGRSSRARSSWAARAASCSPDGLCEHRLRRTSRSPGFPFALPIPNTATSNFHLEYKGTGGEWARGQGGAPDSAGSAT